MVRHLIHEVGRRARRTNPPEHEENGARLSPAPGSDLELALDHADIGTVVADDARLRLVKRAMARLARHFTHHQVIVNHAVLRHLASSPQTTPPPLDPKLAALVASVELQLEEVHAQLEAHRDAHDELRRAIARVSPDVEGERFDRFYRDFEDAFRGASDDIIHRLEVHLEDILAVTADGGRVLDLGSGRGELLALLAANGVDAYGVELSATMAQQCQERGLHVVTDDAISHLRSLPPACLAAVTGVHLAEHLGIDALLDVVDEARRVLRPGGILLLETPNPTTWHVGADLFYLDPTHLRPVHPLLVAFLLSNRGFVEVRTRMFHPYEASPPKPAADVDPAVAEQLARFAEMWGGPQDYVVIGRQPPAGA